MLGVGDLHIENFGTWRDREGRLVWGVNDFDEAARIPYTNDLARLAASARLAFGEKRLLCNPDEACEAILAGYLKAATLGGSPFVLAERHGWLSSLAAGDLRDPAAFWQKLEDLSTLRAGLPPLVKTALCHALPEARLACRFVDRQARLGSLGRRHFVAVAEWRGMADYKKPGPNGRVFSPSAIAHRNLGAAMPKRTVPQNTLWRRTAAAQLNSACE